MGNAARRKAHTQYPFSRPGEAIPNASFSFKILQYVELTTGQRSIVRFIVQGVIFTLFREFPTIAGAFFRGKIYKIIFGRIGNGCLIWRGVHFLNPSRIFLGNRVLIGEHSAIEAKRADSEIFLGNDVYISRFCRLGCGAEDYSGQLVIGDSVHIGQMSFIDATGGVEIGRDSFTGPNVTIISGNHNFQDTTVPIRLQGGTPEKITIGCDVWLGANVTVLGGVNIGIGSVIGAGSLVTTSMPPYSIAVGVPATVIGRRGKNGEEPHESEVCQNT
ncbi:MAG: acyltransferase [Candidatus Hodarchaeota archaeon]